MLTLSVKLARLALQTSMIELRKRKAAALLPVLKADAQQLHTGLAAKAAGLVANIGVNQPAVLAPEQPAKPVRKARAKAAQPTEDADAEPAAKPGRKGKVKAAQPQPTSEAPEQPAKPVRKARAKAAQPQPTAEAAKAPEQPAKPGRKAAQPTADADAEPAAKKARRAPKPLRAPGIASREASGAVWTKDLMTAAAAHLRQCDPGMPLACSTHIPSQSSRLPVLMQRW